MNRTWKLGKKIQELQVGEKLHLIETIEDKDLLLYLGLTNDNNPLYIQHDYTAQTIYQKPLAPPIMLNGIVSSAISKHFPGPGSRILEQQIKYLFPVYHYETIDFTLQIKHIDIDSNTITIKVSALNNEQQTVVEGHITVQPPY